MQISMISTLRHLMVPASKREEIDRWLLSKYNGLVKKVTEAFDEYDLNKVVRALSLFVSEDLSNWYSDETEIVSGVVN